MVDLDEPGPDVHLPRLLPAVHRRGRRAALPGGARPLPVASRTSRSAPASGTSWRSRSGWRSSSATRCRAAPWRSIPGPAGATESELPLGAWDRIVAANPVLGTLRARRRGAARPRCRTGRATGRLSATWCRSTAATSWSAGCGRLWRGFDGGQEARAAARRRSSPTGRARSRPAPTRRCRDARAVVRRPRHRRRSRTPPRRTCSPGCGSRRPPASTVHAIALRCQVRIEPQRRRYDDAEERGAARPVRRPRPLGRRPSSRSRGCTPRPWCRGSPAAPRSTCALPCTYDFEVSGRHVPARARRRRGPAAVPVQRHRVHRGAHRLRRRAGAVGPRGALPAAGRGLARPDGGVLPGTGWVRMRPRHASTALAALPARPRPHQLGRAVTHAAGAEARGR